VLTYTITTYNNGLSDADGVVITDTFSTDLVFKSVVPGSPVCIPLVNPGNQVVCTVGQISSGTSKVITLALNVKMTAANDLVNQGIVASYTIDPNPGNNAAQVSTRLDNEPPSISWTAPVFNDGHYWIGSGVIRLMVNASDNLGITRVRFYRWDEPNLQFVEIGSRSSPPYEWYLNVDALNPGWNEVDSEAYDTAGNVSARQRIFINRMNINRLYFPLMLFR
jgi:hypothetical protein